MKIVIYTKNNKVLEILEDVQNPVVEEDVLTWDDGSLTGIKQEFILLDDNVPVETDLTEEIIALDQKSKYVKAKVDLAAENQSLRERLTHAEDALLILMDRM